MGKKVIIGALSMGLLLATEATAKNEEKRDTTSNERIGYSYSDRSTQSGAIGKVTQERMDKSLAASSLDALNGQAAGVQVTSGSNQQAMVAAVRVRGTTSLTGNNNPLIIIDGVMCDLATLSTIYPADIESFTILKDASETAQYGSRGASGVIEVATKRGKARRFRVSYDATMGFESVYKRMNMLNASQFRQVASNLGIGITDMGSDTNFGKSIERTGLIQNHHAAIEGGNEKTSYRASLGLMIHKSVLKNDDYRNFFTKVDVHQKAFNNRLQLDLGIFGSKQNSSTPPLQQQLLYSAATFNPTFPAGQNPDGTYNEVIEATWINNPYALMELKQDDENANLNAHINATVDISKDWTAELFASYSYSAVNSARYYPTFFINRGEAYRGNEKHENLLANIQMEYKHEWRNHFLNVKALAEMSNQHRTGFYTTVNGFMTDAYGYQKLSAGAVRPWDGTDSYRSDAHMGSFLIHAKYTLLQKYTIAINTRADASSKVGRNHRWGFFPSVSASWLIYKKKEEKASTFRGLKAFVNSAKLRAGFGRSGSLAGIDSYNSMELLQPNGVVSMGGTPVTTMGIIRNANPDLKWEVKQSINMGIDLLLWDKRIAFTADYYDSRTTNMLYVYDVPVPPFTYNKLLANLGCMSNSGLEIGFGITPLRSKDMELTINTNWSFTRNKLESLNGYHNGQYLTAPNQKAIASLWGAGFNGDNGVVMQTVGQPLGVFVLHHCNGLVTNPDGSKSYDVTKEKSICGQAMPKTTMGSNIAFRFKQWDLTIQANGAFGHKIFNGSALSYMNMLSLPNYNVMQGAPEQNIQDQVISDYWLEKGDYVNIDYVTLGWNIPFRNKNIQKARVSFSVKNLATITGYSGLTPMINSSVANSSLGIDDKRSIPIFRTYTLGLNISF